MALKDQVQVDREECTEDDKTIYRYTLQFSVGCKLKVVPPEAMMLETEEVRNMALKNIEDELVDNFVGKLKEILQDEPRIQLLGVKR